ncbi:hypothetical protein [Comamonas jiangduensis]|uniref:Uncharacterized protein n=1 Tax=Comamonas jiangduensis TaxID=1194168 RepID=A0ABV4I9N0_9BURK
MLVLDGNGIFALLVQRMHNRGGHEAALAQALRQVPQVYTAHNIWPEASPTAGSIPGCGLTQGSHGLADEC